MGDNPDHLRLMMRETAARTAPAPAKAPDYAPLRALAARAGEMFRRILAGLPAKAEVK